MGAMYEFVCPGCSYQVEVRDGRDVGMVAVLESMTCVPCHEVVNVLVGSLGEVGKPTGLPDDTDEYLGNGPRCMGTKLTTWSPEHPCPRCGKEMAIGGSGTMWD